MTAPFPHEYRSQLKWQKDQECLLDSEGQQPTILGGPPPQFDGKSHYWSPEELLLSSLQLCLMTTFQVIAKKAAHSFESYTSEALGVLDKTKDGIRFTSVEVTIDIKSPDLEKSQELLLKAKKYCIISNALNVDVELIMKS